MRLRLLRKQQGMTLATVAERTGLTKSYLSKLERGQSSPSLVVAFKLAGALGVDVETLFGENADPAELVTVVRAHERISIDGAAEAGEPRYEGIATGITGNLMVPFMLYPCRADEPWSPFREHEGQEFVFVHRGSAELQTPSDTVRLDVGDSAYFAGTLPHRMRSTGKREAAVLLLISNHPDADMTIPSHR